MQTIDCVPTDHSRLDVDSPWELRFWSEHLRVDAKVLVEAVRAVGCYLGDVVNHLAQASTDRREPVQPAAAPAPARKNGDHGADV